MAGELAPSRIQRAGAAFARLAELVEQPRPDAVITQALTELQATCQEAAATDEAQAKALLTNLTTAVGTWQRVWARMGQVSEFRQAVAREARQWSARLPKLLGSRG